ncbi:hypothetical protein Droror1_Dr00002918 [Drosera rotundifolia]
MIPPSLAISVEGKVAKNRETRAFHLGFWVVGLKEKNEEGLWAFGEATPQPPTPPSALRHSRTKASSPTWICYLNLLGTRLLSNGALLLDSGDSLGRPCGAGKNSGMVVVNSTRGCDGRRRLGGEWGIIVWQMD